MFTKRKAGGIMKEKLNEEKLKAQNQKKENLNKEIRKEHLLQERIVNEILVKFKMEGIFCEVSRYGHGHINDTFLVITQTDSLQNKYILQRINHSIFKEPLRLMKNISLVTSFLKKEIEKTGGDERREVVTIIETLNQEIVYQDKEGSYWRMYLFIDDADCFEQVQNINAFYQSAVAFGRFQKMLQDFDASQLYEVIPNFHHTPLRFEKFQKVVSEDLLHRAEKIQPEIEFFMKREADMKLCRQAMVEKKLPLRVTHNDTKLNNVMMDKKTGKGLCVIDLDTVMPGLSIFDFGDSIRFGANTAVEDETDLSKVSLDLNLFEQYAKGFLEGCDGSLTEEEVRMLPQGAKTMTLECGMRFLTDYLEGDIYFKIAREDHNMDRCRTQIELVRDMERKWGQMEQIITQLPGK